MTALAPLPLSLPRSLLRADFVESPCNAAALALIDAGPLPDGKLVLTGPEGSGKTHLLHVWAAANGATLLQGAALESSDPAALAAHGAIAIDTCNDIAGTGGETALFHLHNLLAAQGGAIAAGRARTRAGLGPASARPAVAPASGGACGTWAAR